MKGLLFLSLFVCYAFANWAIVQNHYETIAISTSFVNSTGGWVSGGTASLDPLFL